MKERKKNRLINFDYSSDNLYFVTNCTKDNIRCFGEIKNGSMVLNEMGEIAHQQWQWLVERYSYLISHAFVVMPNHIHGVLEINRGIVGTGRDLSPKNTESYRIIQNRTESYKSFNHINQRFR